jgi:hypothetical protein
MRKRENRANKLAADLKRRFILLISHSGISVRCFESTDQRRKKQSSGRCNEAEEEERRDVMIPRRKGSRNPRGAFKP